jgi:hypothetical protein
MQTRRGFVDRLKEEIGAALRQHRVLPLDGDARMIRATLAAGFNETREPEEILVAVVELHQDGWLVFSRDSRGRVLLVWPFWNDASSGAHGGGSGGTTRPGGRQDRPARPDMPRSSTGAAPDGGQP